MTTSSRPLHAAEQIRNDIREAVDTHTFLEEFRCGQLNVAELRRFAFQWHLTTTAQRHVFPYSRADAERNEIINILHEHYCNANRANIHERLLSRFLDSIDVRITASDDNRAVDSAKNFADGMRELWSNRSPAVSFGVHFALEVAATLMHNAFAQGVIRSGIRANAAYFWYHETIEPQHADSLTDEFARNGAIKGSLEDVRSGAAAAKERVLDLLDRLHLATFQKQIA